MEPSFRDTSQNRFMAAGVVVGAALLGTTFWLSDGSQGPVMGARTLPGLVAVTAFFAVRALRRGITVDEVGLTSRNLLTTTFVPWSSIVDAEFLFEDSLVAKLADGRTFRFHAGPSLVEMSFAEACRRMMARPPARAGGARPYPRPKGQFLTWALLASAVAVIAGPLVWDDARYDADAYAARARRDRAGVAVVQSVREVEHDNGEGDPTSTTHVEARLRSDGLNVPISLHRPGQLASEFERDDSVPVVYDAAHPTDADFADRPNRNAQGDSVDVRTAVGVTMLVGGLLGGLCLGIAVLVVSARSRPVRDRSDWRLRSAPFAGSRQ